MDPFFAILFLFWHLKSISNQIPDADLSVQGWKLELKQPCHWLGNRIRGLFWAISRQFLWYYQSAHPYYLPTALQVTGPPIRREKFVIKSWWLGHGVYG